MQKVSFFILLTLIAGQLFGQTFPYSPNRWSNPEFVDRFLGTYGVETSREPKINSEESEIFQQVATTAQTDMNAAAALLRQSITPESSAALDYTLANLLLQSGNVPGALRQYRAAIKKFPNFMRAYKNLGLALIQEGNYEEAKDVLVKAVELGDGSGNTYGLLAFCYLNTEQLDAALDAYRIATVLMPDNQDWKVGKAHAYLQTARYEDAISAFGDLILEDPSNEQYFISRSNAYLYEGDLENAAFHLETVRRIGEVKGSVLAQLGNLYLSMEVPNLAYGAFRDALTAPESIGTDRAISLLRTLVGRYFYDEAEMFMADIRDQLSDDLADDQVLDLLNLEAELQLAVGENDKAAEILEKVVAKDPTHGNALYLLGNYYWNTGDLEEAVYYFERAQTIDDSRYKALIDHARLLVQKQEFRDALPLLKSAQSMNPRENVAEFITAVERVVESKGL